MFREDFEFHDAAAPSHLGHGAERPTVPGPESVQPASVPAGPVTLVWAPEAEKELGKIPFFVRGKARRNTERFALERGVAVITVEALYDAKAHFAR